ncbi:MAG: uncharacterized protein KVP18_005103, partial [Porospora cf. gigantea A]|uniref:uncharacterized protein n=1 Tax=Porospora cf. gigantea A TaxID=2853593 RepID=UPI00355A29BD
MGKPKSFRKAPRPRRTGNANEAPLFIWDFEQCDSSKCSGRKLVRFNKIEQLNVKQHGRGVVLSPLAGTFLSLADRDIILSRGLTVVDCSWNRIDEIPFDRLHTGRERKLPFIIAANPTHYGRPYELSCVEALAFSLFLVGLQEQAADILSIFKWGQSFLDLNRELLEFYLKRGTDSSAI